MEKKIGLRLFFYYGGVLDGIMGFLMIYSLFAIPPAIIPFLEAWAAGVPVIGARIGATPEVIRENIDGLLVEFDDPIDIARKVIKLLKNSKLKKKMGLAGQVRVSQNYTWNIVAKKTHQTY